MAKSHRRGFTLVELLVVIAIIAILIGILLPTLAKARRSAQTAACLSNMRQVGIAFQMYAEQYKQALPVGRQDTPEVNGIPQNSVNWYWTDALYPFLLRKPTPTASFTAADAFAYKKSVLWCPQWAGDHPEINVETTYSDRFKNGYGYNIYLSFKAHHPNPDAMVPTKEIAVRSQVFGAMATAANVGKYYRKTEVSNSSDRMIIADSNLWIVGMGITDAQGTIKGQQVSSNITLQHNSTPGGMNIDRFRHGKLPKNDGTTYNTQGGITSYNILFLDWHATTSNSPIDAYKAIRQRYP